MTEQVEMTTASDNAIDPVRMELSSLVGREIVLFTDQSRGRPLKSRVILVNGLALSIDRGGSLGMIDSLVNNQKVVVQFRYKGQLVSVKATLKRSEGGRCFIVLDDKVTPLSRRKFKRVDISTAVKLAVVPAMIFGPKRLSRLRWIQTHSLNFSSGGLSLSLPGCLETNTYLFLNVDVRDFQFPNLVAGQVRYSYEVDSYRFNTGIEFIINELKRRHFPLALLKNLPDVLFEYNAAFRMALEKQLKVWMQRDKHTQEQ